MKSLPDFRQIPYDYAERYARDVFGDTFAALVAQPGGYYRALFGVGYFTLHEDATEPTKSQWNTLKKRMKRVNPGVFVLRDHGITPYEGSSTYFVDFGFLKSGR